MPYKDPDAQKAYFKAYKQRHKERDAESAKGRQLKYLYGISLHDYDRLLEKQNGRCKICGTTHPGGKGRFHVDHNHDTGKVRGLLCNSCNTGLGRFKDSPTLLLSAHHYLLSEGHYGTSQ